MLEKNEKKVSCLFCKNMISWKEWEKCGGICHECKSVKSTSSSAEIIEFLFSEVKK